MKEQLTQYVDLLFAGADHAEEIKMEILQNTLDRYDDLIEQGKTPQAAYSLAISGIGDPSEIIREKTDIGPLGAEGKQNPSPSGGMTKDTRNLLKSIAIALYILCPVPLFIIGNGIGLAGMFTFIASATAILVYCKKSQPKYQAKHQSAEQILTPHQQKRSNIRSLVRSIAFFVYMLLSFLTNAWHITWIIFLMVPAVTGIINACIDLKEEINNEV